MTKNLSLLICIFLTVLFVLFFDGVSENPSIFNIAVLTLTTILITLLFFVEFTND
jgi:hypothetical protein